MRPGHAPRQPERGATLPACGEDEGGHGAVARVAAAIGRGGGGGRQLADGRSGDIGLGVRAAMVGAQGVDADSGAHDGQTHENRAGEHSGDGIVRQLVTPALEVSALAKRYGAIHALRGVDLTVGEAELVGLLGPNGAGKSTLVKSACGLVRPTGGTVAVCGAPAGSPPARRALGYLAELFRFPGWNSADELLLLHQRLAGSSGGAAERAELLELVGLTDAAARRVETMSKGMQQRLGIAQALVGGPRLLLLDEPTSALDPAGRRIVRELLEELRRRGVAVLLNTHLLSEVERVCDRVAIIDRGELLAVGSPDELASATGVEVETEAGTRRFDAATRKDVPDIVERLVAAGERIYDVRVVRSTLEDAYLAVVERGAP
jgi:ABC-2 type transport system ATP-binding protein